MTFNRSPLEENLVTKIKKYLRTTYRRDAWFLKTAGSAAQKSGVPDILICVRGHFFAIETKREDGSGRPSEQQLIECKNINAAGGHAMVSRDFNEIKNLIESVVK